MAKPKDRKRTKAEIKAARSHLRANTPKRRGGRRSKGHAPGWVVAKRARWALAKLKKRHVPLDLPPHTHHHTDSKG
jgi:hypothetical protein